jgi:hypothetical protein
MAEISRAGTHWQDHELDAIVDDYFSMLKLELSGKQFTKSKHSAALMARIGRSHRSVEFKHQNISAVLDELGMPWIKGYRPKLNYQNAIFDAIDRYLTQHPLITPDVSSQTEDAIQSLSVFVEAPIPSAITDAIPARLRRLVRKFDPVERDHRNRALGKAGEEFVLEIERRRLVEADRSDLARKVRWVAAEDGDGAGYDVLSFNISGHESLIEVKTTNGSARTPFYLTRNEREVAIERPEDWRIYRVHLFAQSPRVFTIAPPLENAVNLSPETWRASF